MAEFTPDALNEIGELAAAIAHASAHCGRELVVGYADSEGGLPEAWIEAKPGETPVVTFEPPTWFDLLFDDDDKAEEADIHDEDEARVQV